MNRFDLVLILNTFRRVTPYLPIIKILGEKYKIGVLALELGESDTKKTSQSNQLFLDLCKKFGAEIIDKLPISAKITIIPQWPYSEEQITDIYSNIKSDKFFWLVGLAMGNFNYENLYGNRIDKLLVIDRDFYEYRLSFRPKEREFEINSDSIVEVGLPFDKYPVFPEFKSDYIWANPTPFSLPEIKDRLRYIECVQKLLTQIPLNEIIAYKPHNADEQHDYVINQKILRLMNFPLFRNFREGIDRAACFFARVAPFGKLKNFFLQFCAANIYMELMKRVIPLRDLTPYHNFSLELFLPQVRKGMITGRSNSIWHMLFLKKPVYNCVDKSTITENKEKMNYYSMKYFETPYCNGKLEFDEKHYDIIRDDVRRADIVCLLKKELTNNP